MASERGRKISIVFVWSAALLGLQWGVVVKLT